MKIIEIISEGSGVRKSIGKLKANTIGALQKKWRMNKTNTARWEKIWQGKYGTWLTYLMKFLQLAVPLTYLYTDLDGLDQEYKAGNMSGADLTDNRELLFGIFATQIVTPLVLRKLANTRAVLFVARVLKTLISVGGAAFTAGASIAAGVAMEAFFVWLQTWLSSDKGKDWIINSFIMNNIVRTMGTISDTVWSELTGYYDDKPGAGGIIGGAAGKPTTPGADGKPTTPGADGKPQNNTEKAKTDADSAAFKASKELDPMRRTLTPSKDVSLDFS
jgi:hypothetical protein